jgi:hypothetical protein
MRRFVFSGRPDFSQACFPPAQLLPGNQRINPRHKEVGQPGSHPI